jgi:hypothetical protein
MPDVSGKMIKPENMGMGLEFFLLCGLCSHFEWFKIMHGSIAFLEISFFPVYNH